MCGFVVVVGADPAEALAEAAAGGAARTTSRGPDGTQIACLPGAALASSRLALWDVGDPTQPAVLRNRATVFNGELFNLDYLASRLRLHASEVQVLAEGLTRFGVNWLENIDGQFAIAHYDASSRELILARDRWGICPIYFRESGRRFVAASTVPGVIASSGQKPAVRVAAIADLVSMWHPEPGTTVFEDVREVPPGGYLRVRQGRIVEVGTWFERPAAADQRRTNHDLDHSIESALATATTNLCRGPVRPAALLSGGVDSALLATFATKAGVARSFGLETDGRSLAAQQTIAGRIGLEHTSVAFEAQDYLPTLMRYIATNGTALTRAGPLAMWKLAAAVSAAGWRTVLSGEGADELFLGYDSYKRALLTRLLCRYPESARLRRAATQIGETEAIKQLNVRGASALWSESTHAGLLPITYRMEPLKYVTRFLHAEVRHEVTGRGEQLLNECRRREPTDGQVLAAVQRYEIDILLGGYLLQAQSDNAFAAQAVEARFPFLSNSVSTVAASAAPRQLMVGLSEKVPLRRILARRLSVSGDEMPTRSAFRIGLEPLLRDTVAATDFAELAGSAPTTLFDRAMIARLIERIRRRGYASERETTVMLLAASFAVIAEEFGAQR
jgi:asparagine synthase (glutamine-hydrolysing)